MSSCARSRATIEPWKKTALVDGDWAQIPTRPNPGNSRSDAEAAPVAAKIRW